MHTPSEWQGLEQVTLTQALLGNTDTLIWALLLRKELVATTLKIYFDCFMKFKGFRRKIAPAVEMPKVFVLSYMEYDKKDFVSLATALPIIENTSASSDTEKSKNPSFRKTGGCEITGVIERKIKQEAFILGSDCKAAKATSS